MPTCTILMLHVRHGHVSQYSTVAAVEFGVGQCHKRLEVQIVVGHALGAAPAHDDRRINTNQQKERAAAKDVEHGLGGNVGGDPAVAPAGRDKVEQGLGRGKGRPRRDGRVGGCTLGIRLCVGADIQAGEKVTLDKVLSDRALAGADAAADANQHGDVDV